MVAALVTVCFLQTSIIVCYFPAVIRELREEIKVLQGYLDTANEQIQV